MSNKIPDPQSPSDAWTMLLLAQDYLTVHAPHLLELAQHRHVGQGQAPKKEPDTASILTEFVGAQRNLHAQLRQDILTALNGLEQRIKKTRGKSGVYEYQQLVGMLRETTLAKEVADKLESEQPPAKRTKSLDPFIRRLEHMEAHIATLMNAKDQANAKVEELTRAVQVLQEAMESRTVLDPAIALFLKSIKGSIGGTEVHGKNKDRA